MHNYKTAVILRDDLSPDDFQIPVMMMTADFNKRRGTIFKLDIVTVLLGEGDHPAIFYPPEDGWVKRENCYAKMAQGYCRDMRLRIHGGLFHSFACNWGNLKHAAAESGYTLPPSLFQQDAGGDWRVLLEPPLVDGKVCIPPLRFTAADGRKHPAMRKAFKRAFSLATKSQPFCAKVMERMPEGFPLRAALIRRHPNRQQAQCWDA